ncbi:MAG: RnfABCDGE type electron transport complex subunit A [Candidatus Eisenbacteria sp.]|nr:RnfABCDGE type electron transport complex subunit A [Candidatus Eisenbacteria bacterium]
MSGVTDLIIAFLSIALVNNLVFTKFLGICPYLGVSKKTDMAVGMGLAVTFVLTLSAAMTWMINNLVLIPLDLGFTKYIVFILVIASMVQLVEMYVRKFYPGLYQSFGIFLPLITTNCAILGTCLFIDLWGYGFLKAVVAGFGGGLGFTMAIALMAGIRERLELAEVPRPLQGAGITLVAAGILTLAFMGFSGMVR